MCGGVHYGGVEGLVLLPLHLVWYAVFLEVLSIRYYTMCGRAVHNEPRVLS